MIEGNRRPNLIQSLRELWAFREIVCAFAERNMRVKYKQAVFGVAWAMIQPLAFLAVFTVVFGRTAGMSQKGFPYSAFALSTLVPWMFLQTAVSVGAQALLSDGVLIKKIYFAREAPALGAVLSASIDFAIGMGLLALVGPFLGVRLSWAILFVLPLWTMMAILASGIAMTLGALVVYYRDVRHALPLFMQLWMFASPVAYPVAAVPEHWRGIYIVANPAAGLLDGFRRALVNGQAPDPGLVAISATTTLIIAAVGYLIFKRLEMGFADEI